MGSLVAVPPTVGWVIDAALYDRGLGGPLGLLACLALVQALTTGHRHWVASRIYSGVRRVLQRSVVAAFDSASEEGRERLRPHLVSLAVNDSSRVAVAFDTWCRGSASVVGTAACLVLGFRIADSFGWLLVGICGVLAVVNSLAITRGRHVLLSEQEHTQAALSATVGIVNGYAVRSRAGWRHSARDHHALLDAGVRAVRRANILAQTTRAAIGVSIAAGVVLTAFLLGGAVTAGELSAAVGYVLFLQIPVAAVCEFALNTVRARITLRRMRAAVATDQQEKAA